MSDWQGRRTPFTAGSMTSSVSSVSMPELPNLPGVRRDISLINPKLYREFKASMSRGSLTGDDIPAGIAASDEDNSLMSYFENGSKDYSRILSPYPNNGGSYNDITGRYSLVSQQKDRLKKTRALPYSQGTKVPSFVSNENRVCTFMAYFTEQGREGFPDRSRKVFIKIYLEDSSLEIVEPREENSGTSQGKFLKRHQVVKPDGDGRAVYTVSDMRSGALLNIYNRIYTVIDCDPATRRYVEEELNGVFGMPLPLPDTVYNPLSRAGMSRASSRRTANSSGGVKAYFQYDRKVLRFYGVWDCRGSLFGDELKVKLHYSLAENTIEVVPIHERNAGRDRLPKLLKKSQIPMKFTPQDTDMGFEFASSVVSTEGGEADGSLLGDHKPASSVPGSPSRNVTFNNANASQSAGSLMAQSNEGLVPSRPYHWTDLKIGDLVPVASMHVLLVDADEFTREFYNSKNMPLAPPVTIPPPEYPQVHSTIPPYNGFGSEEDSLQTCKHSLIPTAPSKDGAKLKALAGMVLRYQAVLVNPTEADKSRHFIIQVHLEDDTFQIREPPVRNSGHKGGIFLQRCKLETHDGSKPLQANDIYIGAEVEILTHKFYIYATDPFSFKYMEENCNLWVNSDATRVAAMIKSKKDVLRKLMLTYPSLTTRQMDVDELAKLLEKAGFENMVLQEVHTLFRVVDTHRTGTVKMTQFLKYILDL